jgi:protein required for attachment to host cells
MDIIWIVAANRSRARILEIQPHKDTPLERADLANPAARAHERDLESDAAGRFYGKGEWNQGHVATASESLGEHETERFAADVREYLERGRNEHRFEQLWVIAAPTFLGLLRKTLPKPLRQRVELEIDKDLTTEPAREIMRHALEERDRRRRETGKL